MTLVDALTTTTCDWRVSDLVWTYSIFFVVLGAAAALWGGWLERVGPRKAGVVASCCWSGGLLLGALGVYLHQLWLLWLGTGLIGGIGLGLGYISPVSTLIKWFPDRRGMATGMAIMGFGGGAMIGSPLATILMERFATASQVGVWQTLLVLAVLYFAFTMAGALGYRIPAPGWAPAGWTPPATVASSQFDVHLKDAHRTPQFWLIWLVLFLNVSASIGIIGMASPMLQEIFGGKLIALPNMAFSEFGDAERVAAGAIGAGFVGVISLFNIGGRFLWASSSDKLGRKLSYAVMTAWERCSMAWRHRRWWVAPSPCISWCSASVPRCMAGALPPFRPTWPIRLAPGLWAPSTDACLRLGPPQALWGLISSLRFEMRALLLGPKAEMCISPFTGHWRDFLWPASC